MFFKKRFIDWGEYLEKIEFLEDFNFQQSVRRENIKNFDFET